MWAHLPCRATNPSTASASMSARFTSMPTTCLGRSDTPPNRCLPFPDTAYTTTSFKHAQECQGHSARMLSVQDTFTQRTSRPAPCPFTSLLLLCGAGGGRTITART